MVIYIIIAASLDRLHSRTSQKLYRTTIIEFPTMVITCMSDSLSARILHRAPPPRLQVDQNFLTQKIVADPKMRGHQKFFGIWRVTEAILGQKTCFFSKNIF